MAYGEFQEFLNVFEKRGLLFRIASPVNKDTELMRLVRWYFRGLPQKERWAFLFEMVYDSRGRKFDSPVAVGVLGASPQIYATALGCEPDQVVEKWGQALKAPLAPRVVGTGPLKEFILKGMDPERSEGVDAFPHPIGTPGFDPAPFLTLPFVVTRDPETGSMNVGSYRAQVKGKLKTGIMTGPGKHLGST